MDNEKAIQIIEEARNFVENWSENELSEKLSNVIYYLFENLNWQTVFNVI